MLGDATVIGQMMDVVETMVLDVGKLVVIEDEALVTFQDMKIILLKMIR